MTKSTEAMANIDLGNEDDGSGSPLDILGIDDFLDFLHKLFHKKHRGPYTCRVCKKLLNNHSLGSICEVPMTASWLGKLLPTSIVDDLLNHYPAFEKEVKSSKLFVRSSREHSTFAEMYAQAQDRVLKEENESSYIMCKLCGKTEKGHTCDFVSLPRPWLKKIFKTRPDLVQDFKEDTITSYKKALALPDEVCSVI
jgi:hypothetical protein